MSDAVKPFDPRRKRLQRQRAHARFAAHDFLHRRAAGDVAERLEMINRRFERALLICEAGALMDEIAARPQLQGKIGAIVRADTAAAFAPDVVIDPEIWPFADGAFDLVVSLLHLHWVNDLPGALIQVRRALRPDGLFIGALFGGATLSGLRTALLQAEGELTGGAGLRVAPFADALDMAGLLQRAGFALPVSDVDTASVLYRDPFTLFADLRGMGETAAFAEPSRPLRRDVLLRALDLSRTYGSDGQARWPARFDILTATGWAPHESQQKPLRPGSAKARLADALGVRELPAGDKAGG